MICRSHRAPRSSGRGSRRWRHERTRRRRAAAAPWGRRSPRFRASSTRAARRRPGSQPARTWLVVVELEDGDGRIGVGTAGFGNPGGDRDPSPARAARRRPARRTRSAHIWETMYRSTLNIGRRGVVLHAISAIDIALWDLLGEAARRAGLRPARRQGAARRSPRMRAGCTRPRTSTRSRARRRRGPRRASSPSSSGSRTGRSTAARGSRGTSSWCERSWTRSAPAST